MKYLIKIFYVNLFSCLLISNSLLGAYKEKNIDTLADILIEVNYLEDLLPSWFKNISKAGKDVAPNQIKIHLELTETLSHIDRMIDSLRLDGTELNDLHIELTEKLDDVVSNAQKASDRERLSLAQKSLEEAEELIKEIKDEINDLSFIAAGIQKEA